MTTLSGSREKHYILQSITVNLEEIVQIEPFRSFGTIATIGPKFQPPDSIDNVETPESAHTPLKSRLRFGLSSKSPVHGSQFVTGNSDANQ
jgi:hypothetical protein